MAASGLLLVSRSGRLVGYTLSGPLMTKGGMFSLLPSPCSEASHLSRHIVFSFLHRYLAITPTSMPLLLIVRSSILRSPLDRCPPCRGQSVKRNAAFAGVAGSYVPAVEHRANLWLTWRDVFSLAWRQSGSKLFIRVVVVVVLFIIK